jgi:hypothetical protein
VKEGVNMGIIILIPLFILAVAFVLMPFAVIRIEGKLDDIIRLLKEVNIRQKGHGLEELNKSEKTDK